MEPKITLAGGKHEVFAGFRVSMAAFNAEVAPFRSLGCWDSASMVETGGSCERTVWREVVRKIPNPERDGRQSCYDTPRANWLTAAVFGEKNCIRGCSI